LVDFEFPRSCYRGVLLYCYIKIQKICYNTNMQDNKIYTVEEIRNILQDSKDYFEEKYFVEKFLLFGSYAKNKQTLNSDIDLLVKFKQPIDFFEFIDLQDYISGLFNKRIDLGTVDGLKKFVKDQILREAIVL